MYNTKKGYPLPGPGSHFNDAITIKKIDEEHRHIFPIQKPEEKAKNRMA